GASVPPSAAGAPLVRSGSQILGARAPNPPPSAAALTSVAPGGLRHFLGFGAARPMRHPDAQLFGDDAGRPLARPGGSANVPRGLIRAICHRVSALFSRSRNMADGSRTATTEIEAEAAAAEAAREAKAEILQRVERAAPRGAAGIARRGRPSVKAHSAQLILHVCI